MRALHARANRPQQPRLALLPVRSVGDGSAISEVSAPPGAPVPGFTPADEPENESGAQ